MIRTASFAAALALLAGAASAAGTRGAEFLLQWDADGDGQVTLAEAEARRETIFEMFDQDGDGAFSAGEFALIDDHKALEAEAGHGPGQGMGRGKGMRQGTAQPAAEAMKMFDQDGDGIIVQAEFVAGTSIWFEMRDRNGDGVVTSADFGH